jgi:hypothetical protein
MLKLVSSTPGVPGNCGEATQLGVVVTLESHSQYVPGSKIAEKMLKLLVPSVNVKPQLSNCEVGLMPAEHDPDGPPPGNMRLSLFPYVLVGCNVTGASTVTDPGPKPPVHEMLNESARVTGAVITAMSASMTQHDFRISLPRLYFFEESKGEVT